MEIIGETGRLLNELIEEHRKDEAKSKATSNVYLHVQSTGHTFDFSNVNVITESSNVKLRRRLKGNTHSRLITPSIELGMSAPFITLYYDFHHFSDVL